MRLALLAFLGIGLLLAGCARKPVTPLWYDPYGTVGDQVASFITADDKHADRNIKAVRKLAITSCAIIFPVTSPATDAISLAPHAYVKRKREDRNLRYLYTVVGMDDKELQRITDGVCSDTELKFRMAGFDIATPEELRQSAAYRELASAGHASPDEITGWNLGAYKVFTPVGNTFSDFTDLAEDPKVAGLEARVMDELKVDAVHISVYVDFEQIPPRAGENNPDSLESESLGMRVTGRVQVMLAGSREPGFSYFTKHPVKTGAKFYERIMPDGRGRFNVEVDPGRYETMNRHHIDGFIDMVVAKAMKARNAE